MRERTFAWTAAAALVLTTTSLRAEPQPPLINCWDGSYAYTYITVQSADAGHELRISSQDEDLFSVIFPDAGLDWGQADVDITFADDACLFDLERQLFSCHAREVTLGLTVREILTDEATFSTTATLYDFVIEMVEVIRPEPDFHPVTAYLLTIMGTRQATTSDIEYIRTFIPISDFRDCTIE